MFSQGLPLNYLGKDLVFWQPCINPCSLIVSCFIQSGHFFTLIYFKQNWCYHFNLSYIQNKLFQRTSTNWFIFLAHKLYLQFRCNNIVLFIENFPINIKTNKNRIYYYQNISLNPLIVRASGIRIPKWLKFSETSFRTN